MELVAEKNRLGMTFVISVVIHIALLALIALFAGQSAKPLLPKAKRFVVEFLELPQKTSTKERPKETKRVSKDSRKVAKETIPKDMISRSVAPEAPPVSSSSIGAMEKTYSSKPTEKPAPGMKESLIIGEETSVFPAKKSEGEKKNLPSVSQLTPSYKKLALQYKLEGAPEEIEEGQEISLNTTEFKYVSYFSKLKRRISMVWKYPEKARIKGLQGRLTLRFVLDSDGRLIDIVVVKSSGFLILDEGAVEAVKKAAPFYALPETFGKKLSIVADFQYKLSNNYVKW